MAKISWRPGTLMAPLPPVLVSCGTMEKPNVMTAAWTGVLCSDPTLVYVSLRPSRYSHEIISQTKEFVINLPTVALAKQVDICGVKSGRTVNKFELTGLTAAPCTQIAAPQVAESPISLECRVLEIKHLGTDLQPATHDMFLAEVLSVNVDEQYLDENNALHLEKAGLLAYAHGFYYALGKQLGKFGWSVEKDTTKRKRTEKENTEKSEKKKTFAKRGNFKRKDFKRDSKEDKKGYKPHRSKFGEHQKEERKFKERKTFKRDTENRKPFRKNKTTENKNFEPKAPRKILTLKK